MLVGASLAASGAAFQSIFRNPLVSRGMLGVSKALGLGAALSIILLGNAFLTSPFAFAFAILSVLLSYLVDKVRGGSPTITLVFTALVGRPIFIYLLRKTKGNSW